MAKLERVYNIPLRKEYLNVPPHRRAKRCIVAIRKFLGRHMHSEDVKIGTVLNEYIWHHGMKFPPHHVKVTAVREEDGRVMAELVGAPKKEAKKPEHKHEEHAGHKHEEKKAESKHPEHEGHNQTEKKEAPKKEHKEEKKTVSKKKVEK